MMESEERKKLIQEASQAYYSEGTSPLSDAEFDALLEEERAENPNSPLLNIGHGYVVEKDSTPGEKYKHKYGIMGSLTKCHDYKELASSLKNSDKIAVSLKLDGLSVVLYYEDGTLYQALTRGDGITGIDITNKIQKIAPSYALLKDIEFTGAVRGEIVMPLNNFEVYSKTHIDAKNPRNTTAGLINSKDITDDLEYLEVVVYTVVGIEPKEIYMHDTAGETYQYRTPFNDYSTMYAWLSENFGDSHVVYKALFERDELGESRFNTMMDAMRAKFYGTYPADGLVLTNNKITILNHEIIYDANAFKFKAESTETVITGIEWNLSKTKYLIPTLLVDSVQLSGTTVQRCTGNNAKYLVDNGIGIGAEVEILKSGEIIPKIEKIIKPTECILPDECPECHTKLIWDGVHLKCPNPDCSDIFMQDLLVWCNYIAPTDGLGDTLKIKFFEEFGIKSIEDIYDSNTTVFSVSRGTQKSLFIDMFNKLKAGKVSIASALKALNIPRLGEATSDILAHYPEDVRLLIEQKIPDSLEYKIGMANGASIKENLWKFARLNFIYKNIDFSMTSDSSDKIKVAITGSLSISRKQFESLLNANGFVLSDITKDTKYLITDNPNSGSSKNAKADKLGIEKITESAFRAKYNL